MSKRGKILIIGIVALVIIVVGILFLIKSTVFKEFLIKRDLRKVTDEFYGYYYDDHNSDGNVKKYLSTYKDSGLTISLKDMQIIIENRNNVKTTYKTLEKCDIENTKVIIYPKDPYGKNNIDLKFELECK